ncbi:MAG: 3-deoxy-7-phosphoheptulonate synthase [Candidatus Pacearchaeota archaeon]
MENKLLDKLLYDKNIERYKKIPPPIEFYEKFPISKKAAKTVNNTRKALERILDKKDKRKIIIVGPCSIHDIKAAKEYAERLSKIAKKVQDKLLIIMRTYFEKPRTSIGWTGFLYDPELDYFINGGGNFEKGIGLARQFLDYVNCLGLGCATEFVNTITPQYLAEFISWAVIGARTAESQEHRQLASGLSMPVGFKNTVEGNIKVAVNGIQVASNQNKFLGIDKYGTLCEISTKGNKYAHLVLRGSEDLPNYNPEKINYAEELLEEAGLPTNIIIDCSHGNSGKRFEKQPEVAADVLEQILVRPNVIVGIMLESNLNEGNQPFPKSAEEKAKLKYGVSVTDACISFETTKKIIMDYYKKLKL